MRLPKLGDGLQRGLAVANPLQRRHLAKEIDLIDVTRNDQRLQSLARCNGCEVTKDSAAVKPEFPQRHAMQHAQIANSRARKKQSFEFLSKEGSEIGGWNSIQSQRVQGHSRQWS